jgi:methyltransferase-like protein 6
MHLVTQRWLFFCSPIPRFVYACDFSERAVAFVKSDQRYDATRMHAFVADVTEAEPFSCVEPVDVVSLVFVLSAIHPDKFSVALENVLRALKPGGVLLFRDYGLHDMAQLRFKAGNKLGENFYVRQDGTRSYYFTPELVKRLGEAAGFQVLDNEYVHRMTVNKKEGVEAKRVFVQARLRKPA